MCHARAATLRLMRINRYIVECKLLKAVIKLIMKYRINRYIVECKYRKLHIKVRRERELIDT